jgi:hypothetical protein
MVYACSFVMSHNICIWYCVVRAHESNPFLQFSLQQCLYYFCVYWCNSPTNFESQRRKCVWHASCNRETDTLLVKVCWCLRYSAVNTYKPGPDYTLYWLHISGCINLKYKSKSERNALCLRTEWRLYWSWRGAGRGSKSHNEVIHNFYSSLNIIMVIKTKSIKWTFITHGKIVKLILCLKN